MELGFQPESDSEPMLMACTELPYSGHDSNLDPLGSQLTKLGEQFISGYDGKRKS